MMTAPASVQSAPSRPIADFPPVRSAICFNEVLIAAERLARWEMGVTVAYRPLPDESPRQVSDRLDASMAPLAQLPQAAHLLIHAAALGYDEARLRSALQAAEAARLPVSLDLSVPQRTDALLACVAAVKDVHTRLGVSLSCDRERSLRDVERVCEMGLRVRLVHESGGENGEARRTAAQAMARLVDRVAGRVPLVTLVCHDPQIVGDALDRLAQSGTPAALELLPDLPRQGVLWVARTRRVPVRSCVSYGQPQTLSASGRPARQPRVLWWSALSDSLGVMRTAA